MTYAFVQQSHNSATAAATSISATPGASVGAGNLRIAWVKYEGGDAGVTVGDGVDSFTEAGTVVNDGGTRLRMFYKLNSTAGAGVVTANLDASRTNIGLYVAEYSGIDSFITHENTAAANPGSGTDAISTGLVNVTTQPALFVAWVADYDSDTNPVLAGTGFTSRGQGWTFGTANNMARLQDKRVTATGNTTGTATGAYGSHTYKITAFAFAESTASAFIDFTSGSGSSDMSDCGDM